MPNSRKKNPSRRRKFDASTFKFVPDVINADIIPTISEYEKIINRTRRTRNGKKAKEEGRSCALCFKTETPQWRRDSHQRFLCNACGMQFQIHKKKLGKSKATATENLVTSATPQETFETAPKEEFILSESQISTDKKSDASNDLNPRGLEVSIANVPSFLQKSLDTNEIYPQWYKSSTSSSFNPSCESAPIYFTDRSTSETQELPVASDAPNKTDSPLYPSSASSKLLFNSPTYRFTPTFFGNPTSETKGSPAPSSETSTYITTHVIQIPPAKLRPLKPSVGSSDPKNSFKLPPINFASQVNLFTTEKPSKTTDDSSSLNNEKVFEAYEKTV